MIKILKITSLLFLLISTRVFCQPRLDTLSVEKIMRDPKWIGTSPSDPFWNADGSKLFFSWNPEKTPSDSLYYLSNQSHIPVQATVSEKQNVIRAADVIYNFDRTAYTYEHDGDIFYHVIKPAKTVRVTQTEETEFHPKFSFQEKEIVYNRNQNLFSWNINSGETRQLTDLQNGKNENNRDSLTAEDKWLQKEQLETMQVLRSRIEKKEMAKQYDSSLPKNNLKKISIGDEQIEDISISPDGRFVSYKLYKSAGKKRATIVPDYITESGYTKDIPGREKVGEPQGTQKFFIYNRANDSILEVKINSIEGIRDLPEYLKDYPTELQKAKKENALRKVNFTSAEWSPKGKNLVLDIRSQDHKDRWLMLWDTAEKKLKLLDRQHDSAWIDGPGIWNTGWIDEDNFWYQSEATGYSHLYSVNVMNGKKETFTSGKYEVLDAKLSNDKKYFFISTNEIEPAQQQYYRLRISDKKTERITTMEGGNEVTISPDEKTIAILYSYTNKPWELYLQENRPGGKLRQVTDKAESEEFKSYPWRDPQIITFQARDGATVYGRVYKPTHPDVHKPAVIFVHGAGYLQNIDKWWSYYFREFMFNNMLADKGYYVMDVDYRGSAGYGRDWRTGIYRHMGGKDLTDNIDAAAYLVKNFGVDAKRIGIYGGSYGGFLTLMAMFTTPGKFAAGAGLRSVSDWANYNNGYTSDILNDPYKDSLAYKRSSPIYFVGGLKGHLLMCHGMVDQNVHFQDIVKVTQRLIELRKNDWELAVYPMENHDFEDAGSWTDEYKRIFKLFETVLKK
jgi:dipeptidyl aminopeptidase/acylaminoacyl peptidase